MKENWKLTTDPDTIREWAEDYLARPEILEEDSADVNEPVLRLDFPGEGDDIYLPDSLEDTDLSWQDFFDIMNELNYAFEYNPDYDGDDPSLAYRFVKRKEAESIT